MSPKGGTGNRGHKARERCRLDRERGGGGNEIGSERGVR